MGPRFIIFAPTLLAASYSASEMVMVSIPACSVYIDSEAAEFHHQRRFPPRPQPESAGGWGEAACPIMRRRPSPPARRPAVAEAMFKLVRCVGRRGRGRAPV